MDVREGTCGRWLCRGRELVFGSGPALMGIVNATPDSFSDGGQWLDPGRAVEHGLRLVAEGAEIIDVGGESTRPYSQPVDLQEELRRTIPVVEGLARQTGALISIDTSKPGVARAALDAGASIINDVAGLGDPAMVAAARQSGAGVCVMHMQGTPQTMQEDPRYGDVVADVLVWLRHRIDGLAEAGVEPSTICADPGIGFGKTHAHNLELLAAIARFHELGRPLLVGHSRKGFIGKLAGDALVDRDAGTLGASLHLALAGVQIFRLHAVRETAAALKVLKACRPDPLPHCYRYPRPAVAVDLAVLRGTGRAEQEILLIQRGKDPFAGRWALPGGFVDPGETVEEAAARELLEETGLRGTGIRQVGVWSDPRRDPRGRVITVFVRAEVAPDAVPCGQDDAADARWFGLDRLPELAFDHAAMIASLG